MGQNRAKTNPRLRGNAVILALSACHGNPTLVLVLQNGNWPTAQGCVRMGTAWELSRHPSPLRIPIGQTPRETAPET